MTVIVLWVQRVGFYSPANWESFITMNHKNEMVKNTSIYFIGNIGTKLITYFLTPLYTMYLLPEEYAVADLYYTLIGTAIMIMTGKVAAAMFRYVADRNSDKEEVLSNTICVIIGGSVLFYVAVLMISQKIDIYIPLVVMASLFIVLAFNEVVSSFLKAINENRLYLIHAIIAAIAQLCFSYILLKKFRLGILGYFYSNLLAYIFASTVIFFKGKIYRFIKFSKVNNRVIKKLLNFSLPIVPVSIIMWLVQYSDRYIVMWEIDSATAGLYAVSYKIPGIAASLIAAFNNAWGLSAIREKYNVQYYSDIFENYFKILACVCSGVILLAKPLALLLFRQDFFAAWKYVPLLVVAYMFNFLREFLEYIYQVREETAMLLRDSILGACMNILLNFIMIKYWGVYGVIFATVISYMILFLSRYHYLVKIKNIKRNLKYVIAIGCLLIIQAILTIVDTIYSNLFSLVITLYFVIMNKPNIEDLWRIIKNGYNR